MGIHKHISICFILALLAFPLVVSAKSGRPRSVWSSRQNSRNGLYSTKNEFVSHGVSFGLCALYYYGDVDNEGLAFSGGFNKENLSFGGSLAFVYNLPAGNHCNLRFGLMGGFLRGNNEAMLKKLAEPRDDYRKFQSILVEPSFGVQYYPFSNAGFYLYGGVAVAGSIITNYEFWYYKRVGNEKQRSLLKGSTYGFLPIVQLGIGYSWHVADHWTMSAEIMVQEGLVDTYYMNLDAFPLAASQNSDNVDLGKGSGSWIDGKGNLRKHWTDGWFQVGLTVTYHWPTCERCRMINNYANIKPSRYRR